jgi:hypothetical protein
VDKKLAEKYIAVVVQLMADNSHLAKPLEHIQDHTGWQAPEVLTERIMRLDAWLVLQSARLDVMAVAAACWVFHVLTTEEQFYRGRVQLVHKKLRLGGHLLRRGRPPRPYFREFLLCCDRLTSGRSDGRRFHKEFCDLTQIVFSLKKPMRLDVFQRAVMQLRADRRAARRDKLKLVKKAE